MPRLPTYDQPAVQQQGLAGPMNGNRANPSMFYNAEGMQDLSQAVDTIAKVAQKRQLEDVEMRVKEKEMVLQDQLRQVLHDPEKGYLFSQGKGAMDSRETVLKSIDEIGKRSLEGANDPLEQRALNRVWSERRLQAVDRIDVHAGQQRKLYQVSQSEERAKQQIPDMVLNYVSEGHTDPDGKATGPYATAKATMLQEIERLGQLKGLPAEEVANMKRGALTTAHAQVIQQMIADKNSKGANDYFKKYGERGEILEDKKAEIKNTLDAALTKTEGLDLSMAIQGQFKGEREQLAEVDRQYKAGGISAEVRDNAKVRIEHDAGKVRAARDEGNKWAMGQSQEWILKNPGKSVLDMPDNLYQWAKGNGSLAGLEGFARREGRPAELQKELATRGSLLTQAQTDPDTFIAEFKRTGFADRLDLGSTGIKEMQNIASDMIRGSGKYKTDFDQKIMVDAMPPSLRTSKDKDKQDAFVALQHEAMATWKQANPGKVPSNEQQREVANAANAQWIDIGHMWNSSKAAYEVKPTDVKSVPKDFYAGMTAAGATEEEILAAWKFKQGQKR